MEHRYKTLRITPEVIVLLMGTTPRHVSKPLPSDVKVIDRDFNARGDIVLTLSSSTWPDVGAMQEIPEIEGPIFHS